MSVPVGKRGEGKLEVLNDCRILSEYTLRACKNEKVFPKSNRWIITQRLVNECIDAVTCIRRANATLVQTRADYEYRRSEQVKAHAHLEALLTLLDLSYNVLDLESRRVEHWTGLIINTEERLKAWAKSDRERYKKVITG